MQRILSSCDAHNLSLLKWCDNFDIGFDMIIAIVCDIPHQRTLEQSLFCCCII